VAFLEKSSLADVPPVFTRKHAARRRATRLRSWVSC
jgi:hypothetical protein